MAIKSEISWTRRDEDGTKTEVYARRSGGTWQFHSRQGRYEVWRTMPTPSLEDWLALVDAVKRRVARRLHPPDELDRLQTEIRNRFPDAPSGRAQD